MTGEDRKHILHRALAIKLVAGYHFKQFRTAENGNQD